jgi:hypothetical protein
MRYLVLTVLALITLAGCTAEEDRIRFDGQLYRAKLSSDSDNRRAFTATASPVSNSLQGAREAAAYEAISYCVRQYGTSRILWDVGPDTADDALPIDRDTLSYAGTCRP